jgi:hypothetical protein
VQNLNNYANRCDAQLDNLNALRNKGDKAVQDAKNNMNPSSTNPNNNPQQNQMQPVTASTQPDCSNPVNAGTCAQQAETASAANDKSGTGAKMVGNQGAPGIPNASGMDVGGTGSTTQQQAQYASNTSAAPAAAQAGIPMGGSSGSGFGNNQNNNNNANAAAPQKGHGMQVAAYDPKNTLQGERGGGGGGSNPGRGLASESGRRRGRGGGGADFAGLPGLGGGVDEMGRMRGLDLKAYLPGGARYGGRVAGAGARADLHGPNENLFNPISNRFQIHCKLQLLYGCR